MAFNVFCHTHLGFNCPKSHKVKVTPLAPEQARDCPYALERALFMAMSGRLASCAKPHRSRTHIRHITPTSFIPRPSLAEMFVSGCGVSGGGWAQSVRQLG